MKVGLVCPYAWDVPGGVKAHIADLVHQLQKMGHECGVIAPAEDEDAIPDYVTSAGRPVPVPYNGSVARLAFGPFTLHRVRRWLAEGDYDVLHIHEPMSPSTSLLACWAADGPVVATFHTSNPRSRIMAAVYPIAQTALEKIDARIAVSEYARSTLVEHLGGDAILIPNGVDVSAYDGAVPNDAWRGSEGTLAFLGRIDEPRKGLKVLLEAYESLLRDRPGLRLLVAGPGDIEQVRTALPPRLVDRITFLGLVSEEDKARMLATADVYVAPNLGGESFGIILLEAMAAGAPVLASDLDAFERVLDGGRSGVLFRTGDPADLAAKADELLGDAALRAEMTERGNRTVQRYDWRTVAKEIVAVYEMVARPGARVGALDAEGPSDLPAGLETPEDRPERLLDRVFRRDRVRETP